MSKYIWWKIQIHTKNRRELISDINSDVRVFQHHQVILWHQTSILTIQLNSNTVSVWKSLNCVWLFATPWTKQSMEFSRPEYWSGYSLSLLQGIFPIQGLNPGLLHCWQILYQLKHKESPRILEWVVYPFSRGSSNPGNEPESPAL